MATSFLCGTGSQKSRFLLKKTTTGPTMVFLQGYNEPVIMNLSVMSLCIMSLTHSRLP